MKQLAIRLTNRIQHTLPAILAIIVGVIAVQLLAGSKVYAAPLTLLPDPGVIPPNVRSVAENANTVPQTPALAYWLSDYGRSDNLISNATVQAGATSLPLRFNWSGTVGYSNAAVAQTALYWVASPTSNSPPADVTGLPGGSVLKYNNAPGGYNVPGTYRQQSHDMNFSPAGGFTTSGVYTILLYVKRVNEFTDGTKVTKYLCVNGSPAGHPQNILDYTYCDALPLRWQVYVTVQPNPPKLDIANAGCDGINVASDGNQIDIWSGVQVITKGQPPNGHIDLKSRGVIPKVTKLQIYAVGGPPTSTEGETRRDWVWEPPVDCPVETTDFQLHPIATTNFNNVENPDSVTFSGTIAPVLASQIVNGINITCTYTLIRGGTESPLGDNNFTDVAVPALCGKTIPVSGLTAGDQACQVVTASPGSGKVDSSGARDKTKDGPAVGTVPPKICDTVVNKPYTKVQGGDVRAGVNFTNAAGACASTTDKTVRGLRGKNLNSSAVQFAAFASGVIGAGDNGQFASAARIDATTGLSFANVPTLGGYTYGYCNDDYFKEADGLSGTAGGSISVGSGNTLYKSTGSISIDADTTIPVGFRQTIYVNGDLVIKHNITYASGYTTTSQIPYMRFVVKGNIYIEPGVSRLDGWYIAQPTSPGVAGIIYTCAHGTTPYTTIPANDLWDNCRTKLTVHGAFTANEVKLLRTKNSLRDGSLGEGIGSPTAEEFVFSPELWLVAPPRGNGTGSVTNAPLYFITSLPPVL